MNPQTAQTEIGAINFSLEKFPGCTTFRYKRTNVIINETVITEIYGVTDSQGKELINQWNGVAPWFWFYELVEEKETV